MRFLNAEERKLTELDFIRLNKLATAGAAPHFDEVLYDAEVVPSKTIPADVVTMHTMFVVHDLKLQRQQTFVLCYPRDAEPATGHLCVLSPAGMALLGLPVGALATWTGPRGEENTARIEGILFQPQASGGFGT
jgi:regulator of nucleoside diphosphate kinase